MIIFGLFLLFVFLLALTANRLARTVLTAPMIFTLVGKLIVLLLLTATQSEVESEPSSCWGCGSIRPRCC